MDREPQPRDIVRMPDSPTGELEAVIGIAAGQISLRPLSSREPVRVVALPPLESIHHAGYLSPCLV
jgi:hypothetical protein